MLDKNLKNKYTIIKYNCWENSYYNDPLEAILSVMVDYIERDKLWTDENKEKIKLLLNSILLMLSFGTFKVKLDYRDNFNELKQYIKDGISSKQINNIFSTIQEVKHFLKLNNNEKIVILVDEIDRCLPEYAIKTLERLHLLFKDMSNIVLVIANDKSKLEKSVKNAFGYDSIDNYLEKFTDYNIELVITYPETTDGITAIYTLYSKYDIFNQYFDMPLNEIKKQSVLSPLLVSYLVVTKNMRYVKKIVEFHSNVHMLIFKNEKHLPLYVFAIELLMLMFSNKKGGFTFENIRNHLDFFDAMIKYDDSLGYIKVIRPFELKAPYSTRKEDQKVLLFFDFMDEMYKKSHTIPIRLSFKKPSESFVFRAFEYENDPLIKLIESVLADNHEKYDDIKDYISSLFNFYRIIHFIKPI